MNNYKTEADMMNAFIGKLIKYTQNDKLIWHTMAYQEYNETVDYYDKITQYKSSGKSLAGAAKALIYTANVLAEALYDMNVYYTTLNNVDIYLIEQVDYHNTLPKSRFELTLLNNSDDNTRFKYTLEFKNDEEKNKLLSELASYVIPLFYIEDDKENAMEYIKSIIDN